MIRCFPCLVWMIPVFGSLAIAVAAEGEPRTTAPRTSAELWRQYQANPDDHLQVPNVSYAGYRGGEAPLPDVKEVANVRDHGAVGDGKADDTKAFQSALATAAEAGGGAVTVPPGTYRLTDVLRLSTDGVVLRGAGRDRTVLLFDASLNDALGEYHPRWNWLGGMIWIGPDEDFDEQGKLRWRGASPEERWPQISNPNKPLANVTEQAPRGERQVTVDRTDHLQPGQWVQMSYGWNWRDRSLDERLLYYDIAGHERMKEYPWRTEAAGMGRGDWRWPVQIERIDGQQVTLSQPLRVAVRPDQWITHIVPLGPFVQEIGVERLTVRFAKPNARLRHNEANVGNNGIYLLRAINCWVYDVEIEDAENGLIVAASKQTTAAFVSVRSRTPMHHAFANRVVSHDNLVTDFHIDAPVMHGINTEGLGSGNVWRRGRMIRGTFDSHRGMPFDFVRTDITLVHNDGSPGGGSGPSHGRRVVHWNIRVEQGDGLWVAQPEMHSHGAVVGIQGTPVSDAPPVPKTYRATLMVPGDKGSLVLDEGREPDPPDLYEAQLRHRLGHGLQLGRPSPK